MTWATGASGANAAGTIPTSTEGTVRLLVNDTPLVGVDLAAGTIGTWPDGETWSQVAVFTPPGTAPTTRRHDRPHTEHNPLTDIADPPSRKTMPLNPNGHVISRTNEVTVSLLRDGFDPMFVGVAHSCAVCDTHPKLQITADSVQVQDPCLYPDGITTEITLSVPSGKLLVTDDLRPVYDCDNSAYASYNSILGQAQMVKAMAAIGFAYGPVGNSCPGLYRTGVETYIIASPYYGGDDTPSLPEDTCLATICTDLWAYSIADFEHWKARGGDPETLDSTDTVVDVQPGTYRFTHHTGERDFDRDVTDTVVFAHVERIA